MWLRTAIGANLLILAAIILIIGLARESALMERWLVFAAYERNVADLMLMDVQRARSVNLTRTPQNSEVHPVWSPDGSSIAYESYGYRPPFPNPRNWICTLNVLDGTQGCLASFSLWDRYPRWTPDGAGLTFEALENDWGIYLVEQRTSRPRRLIDARVGGVQYAWSPDGTQIAVSAYVDGRSHILIMTPETDTLEALTVGDSNNFGAAWSPDGTRIAFVSDRNGAPQIYIYLRTTGETQRLTTSEGSDYAPQWSPDGGQIAFIGDGDGGDFDLYVVNADGTNRRQITRNPYNDEDFAWSPDGTQIAFVSDADAGRANIYLVGITQAGGSVPRQLTDAPNGYFYAPVWRPRASR